MKFLPSFIGILFIAAIWIVSCQKETEQPDNSLTIINLIRQVETLQSGCIDVLITKQEYRKIHHQVYSVETVDSTETSIEYIVWSETPYRGILAHLTVYQ